MTGNDRKPMEAADRFDDAAYLASLDGAKQGDDLRAPDYIVLVILGVVVPILLSIWGYPS